MSSQVLEGQPSARSRKSRFLAEARPSVLQGSRRSAGAPAGLGAGASGAGSACQRRGGSSPRHTAVCEDYGFIRSGGLFFLFFSFLKKTFKDKYNYHTCNAAAFQYVLHEEDVRSRETRCLVWAQGRRDLNPV